MLVAFTMDPPEAWRQGHLGILAPINPPPPKKIRSFIFLEGAEWKTGSKREAEISKLR